MSEDGKSADANGKSAPVLWWVRRDLRLADNPALHAALSAGAPVIPVFVHEEVVTGLGAAPRWRLGLGVERFAQALEAIGSRLILRRGDALDSLHALAGETGARCVVWSRLYDPDNRRVSETVKAGLEKAGLTVNSCPGQLLFEPWTVETGSGGYYKVFTPMWKAVRDRALEAPLPAPRSLEAPADWPRSDDLADWRMGAAMDRGAAIVAPHLRIGELAARERLDTFMDERVDDYATARDRPDLHGTSSLSENLTYGEISPRTCWHAGLHAREKGRRGAETFVKELVWREFAYHLAYHTPRLTSGNWRQEWDAFPWNEDRDTPEVAAWTQGRTGVPFVDAAMRELYVTGTMHNRARMIVASYLTKHLMSHWKVGADWFAEHLVDWDPASNALGWQWAAGSGPDAAPYFRVFNPVTQREKFDPQRAYVDAWIAEGRADPSPLACAYFEAIPRRWNLSPRNPYPPPLVALAEGRERALKAYRERDF